MLASISAVKLTNSYALFTLSIAVYGDSQCEQRIIRQFQVML